MPHSLKRMARRFFTVVPLIALLPLFAFLVYATLAVEGMVELLAVYWEEA